MVENLRDCLQKLNNITLTDSEWNQLLKQIADNSKDIEDKTDTIQRNEILNITLDNGATKNIKLIDKREHTQQHPPGHQPVQARRVPKNRYDVTILINGLPLVHIELKKAAWTSRRRSTRLTYQNDRFGVAPVSTTMCRFSSSAMELTPNTTATPLAIMHVEEMKQQKRHKKTDANSFEFTSYWSDQECHNLPTWRTSLARSLPSIPSSTSLPNTVCSMPTKQLLVMRPYQITATEKIIQRINGAMLTKLQGTIKGWASGTLLVAVRHSLLSRLHNWPARWKVWQRSSLWWTERTSTTRPWRIMTISRSGLCQQQRL